MQLLGMRAAPPALANAIHSGVGGKRAWCSPTDHAKFGAPKLADLRPSGILRGRWSLPPLSTPPTHPPLLLYCVFPLITPPIMRLSQPPRPAPLPISLPLSS